MERWDLPLPADPAAWVRQLAERHGLVVLESTLTKFPGSVHWHLRRAGQIGTLEVTWWPRTDELWASVHSNRRADWMEPILAEF